jgi:TIR domain
MEKLKVFISWSGRRSQQVAEALRDWLPNVFQNVEPWLSTSDIDKGAMWRSVIERQLQESNFGLICLTPENLKSLWLHFEAGALSKKEESRLCTYLYDLKFENVKDPLSQFHHTEATEGDTKKLLNTINKAMPNDASLAQERLDKAFQMWWPELEKMLSGIQIPSAPPPPERNERDMISEILNRVRALESVLVPREISDVSDNLKGLRSELKDHMVLQQVLLASSARLAELQKRADSLSEAGERGVEYEMIRARIAEAKANLRAVEARQVSGRLRPRIDRVRPAATESDK